MALPGRRRGKAAFPLDGPREGRKTTATTTMEKGKRHAKAREKLWPPKHETTFLAKAISKIF